jgi:hypothetical protein
MAAEREEGHPPGSHSAREGPEPAGQQHLADVVLRRSSRRGFLERAGAALIALAGGRAVARLAIPDDAHAYTNFCGHTFTTGNCPHPTGLPRVDLHGYPLRAADGYAVDDLGRPINASGYPVDAAGEVLREPDGEPLAPAPCTRVCRAAGTHYGHVLRVDGSWYRCCGGQVRRLMDCCGHTSVRINGDAALSGYCHVGRHVFCVQYYETRVPC